MELCAIQYIEDEVKVDSTAKRSRKGSRKGWRHRRKSEAEMDAGRFISRLKMGSRRHSFGLAQLASLFSFLLPNSWMEFACIHLRWSPSSGRLSGGKTFGHRSRRFRSYRFSRASDFYGEEAQINWPTDFQKIRFVRRFIPQSSTRQSSMDIEAMWSSIQKQRLFDI